MPDHIAGVKLRRRRTSSAATTEVLRAPAVHVRADVCFKEAKEEWVSAFEKEYLESLLTKHGGNLSQAAREAAVDRKHFRRLARKYGLVAASANK